MIDKVFFVAADPHNAKFFCAQYEYGAALHGAKQKVSRLIAHERGKHGGIAEAADEVWYNGAVNPLMQPMREGQIYILGHGMPGFVSIELGRGGERIDYVILVRRLMESGLHKEFRGKIKCYNCHSAERGTPGTDPEIRKGNPFAQYVADELYAHEYRSCTIFGYHGSLDSFPKAGREGIHKYVRAFDDLAHAQVEVQRASAAREEFEPRLRRCHPSHCTLL